MTAITTFAHGALRHLTLRRRARNPDIEELDYASFEDALWDFLDQKKILNGSTLLIPDFFCMDVLSNIIDHGYQFELYLVDEVFQPRFDILCEKMQANHVSVVFLFHALGIENQVCHNANFWRLLRKDQWVIEDSVHRLVEPAAVSLKSSKHIVIDSTRKITPFFGATLYGDKNEIGYSCAHNPSTNSYVWRAILFWIQFQWLLVVGKILNQPKYLIRAYDFLNSGDNLIGDSLLPARLPWIFSLLKRHISVKKIKKVRLQQAQVYKNLLHTLYLDYRFVLPTPYLNNTSAFENLAFFPLPFHTDFGFLLREYLLNQGICTFIEFSDSPWAINKNVLCLPLGAHLKNTEIELICEKINTWHAKNYQL